MLKILFFILFSTFSLQAKVLTLSKKDHRNGLDYIQYISADVNLESPFVKKYREIQMHINLQVDYPEARIVHIARDEKGQKEFSKFYTTTKYGFRSVPFKPYSKDYLIIAGDSNIFGIGSDDDETISGHLSQLLPHTQIINMGMAGTAGNALLYFLDNYKFNEVITNTEQKGILLYDFNDYLIERMIGGKNFIKWGWMQPAYKLENNKLVYEGTFNDLWMTKFYKVINLVDPKNILFPNLPRVGDSHLKLAARIFLEIKNRFLAQTRSDNKFAVLINPFTLNDKNRAVIGKFKNELSALGINTIQFEERESLNHISIYPRDLHMRPDGQRYYAARIAEKIK
jgi:hypothetical protein